jgi:Family of unknown function (DUF5996)
VAGLAAGIAGGVSDEDSKPRARCCLRSNWPTGAGTKDTLHLFRQIVGKIRMATTPPRNHCWHVPLYVDVRGLTTRPMHHRGTTFEITFD